MENDVPPQAHMPEHLVPVTGAALESQMPFGGRASIEETGHRKQPLRSGSLTLLPMWCQLPTCDPSAVTRSAVKPSYSELY